MDKKELITVLSAQKEEQRPTAISKPNVESIDKFVNSIESLQQRLTGLSLDEVIEAERKAEILKGRLIDLQNTVTALSDLKQQLAKAAHAIEQAPVASLSSLELEASSRPLHLQQLLVASSKLIPFPRPNKTTRDKPKNSAVDARKEIAIATNRVPPERAVADHAQADGQEHSTKPRNESAEPTVEPAKPKPSKQKDLAPKPLDSIQPETASVKQISAPQEIEEEGVTSRVAPHKPDASLQGSVEPEFPRQEEVPAGQFDFSHDPITNTRDTDDGEFLDVTASQTPPIPEGPQVDFDQRLLDDLIRNYGEFAVSPNLPAVMQPEVIQNEPKRQKATSAAHTSAHGTRKNNLPLNKEAEIDRQLKQIIKDYGQYDLYSQPSQTNLKRGVIAAFALLGVLFFGFYFFSSPTPPREVSPTQQQESSTAVGADRGQASGAHAETDLPTEKTSKQHKN